MIAWTCLIAASAISQPLDVQELATINAAMRAANARVQSISYKYQGKTLVETRKRHSSYEDEVLAREVFVGPATRYVATNHLSTIDSRSADLNHSIILVADMTQTRYYPTLRYVETFKLKNLADTWVGRGEFYLDCVGWSLTDSTRQADVDGNDIVIRTFPENKFGVESMAGDLDAVMVVNNQGTDRVILSRSQGYAVIRREVQQPDGDQRVVTELDDLREVGGIFLPRTITRTIYERGGTGREGERITSKVVCQVELLALNEPSSHHAIAIPPGTLRCRLETRELQQQPGGLEFLDETVALALVRHHLRSLPTAFTRVQIAGIAGILTVVAVLVIGVRFPRWAALIP